MNSLRKSIRCKKYRRIMKEQKKTDALLRHVFRCPGCRARRSITSDSILENMKIAIKSLF